MRPSGRPSIRVVPRSHSGTPPRPRRRHRGHPRLPVARAAPLHRRGGGVGLRAAAGERPLRAGPRGVPQPGRRLDRTGPAPRGGQANQQPFQSWVLFSPLVQLFEGQLVGNGLRRSEGAEKNPSNVWFEIKIPECFFCSSFFFGPPNGRPPGEEVSPQPFFSRLTILRPPIWTPPPLAVGKRRPPCSLQAVAAALLRSPCPALAALPAHWMECLLALCAGDDRDPPIAPRLPVPSLGAHSCREAPFRGCVPAARSHCARQVGVEALVMEVARSGTRFL